MSVRMMGSMILKPLAAVPLCTRNSRCYAMKHALSRAADCQLVQAVISSCLVPDLDSPTASSLIKQGGEQLRLRCVTSPIHCRIGLAWKQPEPPASAPRPPKMTPHVCRLLESTRSFTQADDPRSPAWALLTYPRAAFTGGTHNP